VRTVGDAPARSSPSGRPGGERGSLDAAERAELDALRIRAYGPSSDIAGDGAALSRLVELEERALPRSVRFEEREERVVGDTASPLEAAGAEVDPAPDPAPTAPEPFGERRPGRGRHMGAVAAVAVLAIALGAVGGAQAVRQAEIEAAQERSTPETSAAVASEPDGDILIRVFIDASTGDYVDLSADADVPPFPISGQMSWAQPLGEYYGWALWIGAAPSRRGNEHCLLLAAESGTRSRCVAREWRADGDLVVSVPYAQIAPDERPAGMTPEQSVSFLWGPGGFVTIMITPGAGD
jgi:hypothetical protein